MVEEGGEVSSQQVFSDINTRIRDFEEKQRLLKDRVLLVGQSLVEERDKNFSEIQILKKDMIKLKEDTLRIKEMLQRITEQLEVVPRKEELMILQRQFDLFRK